MKTHRLIVECNDAKAADSFEAMLADEFCDFTHWYCGLDGAGDDTPDLAVIFRGIIHPEKVFVEFDLTSIYGKGNDDYIKKHFESYANLFTEKADCNCFIKSVIFEKLK